MILFNFSPFSIVLLILFTSNALSCYKRDYRIQCLSAYEHFSLVRKHWLLFWTFWLDFCTDFDWDFNQFQTTWNKFNQIDCSNSVQMHYIWPSSDWYFNQGTKYSQKYSKIAKMLLSIVNHKLYESSHHTQ